MSTLLKKKKKDSKGETALHFACRRGDEVLAKLLLQNGVDFNAQNSEGLIIVIVIIVVMHTHTQIMDKWFSFLSCCGNEWLLKVIYLNHTFIITFVCIQYVHMLRSHRIRCSSYERLC
jgi:hypothetical protein